MTKSSQPATSSDSVPEVEGPASEPDRAEQRRAPRVAMEAEVGLETEDNFYDGIIGDLSQGGVFVATHNAPPSGTRVQLKLSVNGVTFELQGIVRWMRTLGASSEGIPPGCGVQFIDLPDAARAAITRFVKAREPLLFDDD